MPYASRLTRTTTPRTTRGMTLIELMIGLAVLALLMMSGAPAFSDWIRNTQIRSAAESIIGGIQYARTEAVRRNAPTRFQLMSSLDAQCDTDAAGRNWVVNLDEDRKTSPAGQCNMNIDSEAEPYILQKAAATTNQAIAVEADREVFAFNSLGQQIATEGVSPLTVSVIRVRSEQGECAKPDGSGGTARCLNIEVSRGGQARMCDPGLAVTPANQSMACEAL